MVTEFCFNMIICKYWFELHFCVNQRSFLTFEITGVVIVNLSQNITVLSSNSNDIYAANDECCCRFFALNACLFT